MRTIPGLWMTSDARLSCRLKTLGAWVDDDNQAAESCSDKGAREIESAR